MDEPYSPKTSSEGRGSALSPPLTEKSGVAYSGEHIYRFESQLSGDITAMAQDAAGNRIPRKGGVFLSIRDADKAASLPAIRQLAAMDFTFYATAGTGKLLYEAGIPCNGVFRLSQGRPDLRDLVQEHKIGWIVNIPDIGDDGARLRSIAIEFALPITTTTAALQMAADGLENSTVDAGRVDICSLQEYERKE